MMKSKIFPAALCLLFLSVAAFAQSVQVTPRKITYRRPKPLASFKKTFTVTYPKVKAATPALATKIESAISFQKIFNLNLKEEINEIQWLEEAGYEVGYNARNILSITLTLSGTGAYSSVYSKTAVVDLRTGARVLPADVFIDLQNLAAQVRSLQREEIRRAAEEYKNDPSTADFDASEYFERADFTVENLKEFAVGENGVTFTYDYGFPHVALALEPDGTYFFSWAELKPFIKLDGLFGRFR